MLFPADSPAERSRKRGLHDREGVRLISEDKGAFVTDIRRVGICLKRTKLSCYGKNFIKEGLVELRKTSSRVCMLKRVQLQKSFATMNIEQQTVPHYYLIATGTLKIASTLRLGTLKHFFQHNRKDLLPKSTFK